MKRRRSTSIEIIKSRVNIETTWKLFEYFVESHDTT
jgi:hypothetical protein